MSDPVAPARIHIRLDPPDGAATIVEERMIETTQQGTSDRILPFANLERRASTTDITDGCQLPAVLLRQSDIGAP